MVYSILFVCSILTVTLYLILTAREDAGCFEVTRIKHLMGLIPALCILLLNLKKLSMFDLGMTVLFVLLCLIIGVLGIYGMADGFVFANLTVLFGGIGGSAGVSMVILIMILACFSGLTEMMLRKMITWADLKRNSHIAFVPHILTGYVSVMIALMIWI